MADMTGLATPQSPFQRRSSNIEMQAMDDIDYSSTENAHAAIPSLPAADGGRAAWLFLAGCFVIETLLWGFPFSYGVLQEYYSTHEPLSQHPSGISAVGTTCSGILYLTAPLMFALLQRWPEFRRKSLIYGLLTVSCSLVFSSFAKSVWQLILMQGLMYAVGGGFLYTPIFFFIDEWFIRRKGFAYGVMWAGSGCGGLAGPLVMNWGLARYGHEVFLRGWPVAMFLLIGPLLYFIRPRVPISRSSQARSIEFGFVRTRTFWALQLGNIIQGLGYFIPALYLPTYARTLGLSPLTGSLMVSLLNSASVPGVVVLSALCDRIHVTNVVLISALGSALSIFLLWGFPTSLPVLSTFAVLYGFFAGGFTATNAGTVQEVRRVSTSSDLGSIFGLLSAGRGIGNVICGPLSEALLKCHPWNGRALFAYGSDYGVLIVFTGLTATFATVSWVSRMLRLI